MKKRRMLKTNRNFIGLFKRSIIRTTAKRMRLIADSVVDSVKTVLEKQLYHWPPLTEKYAKSKQRKGLDPRILIATGKYKDAIQVIREETREDGVTYSVGVPGTFETGPKTARKKLPLELLGRWLEFGTKSMPPREHWRPVWSALVRNLHPVTKKLKKDILKEFKNSVRRTDMYRDRTVGAE